MSSNAVGCEPPPEMLAWTRLVERSIAAWVDCTGLPKCDREWQAESLRRYESLDQFMDNAAQAPSPMFWFFQRRYAFLIQKRLPKWSRDDFEQYVLLPAAPGSILREKCFFVSHFWLTPKDPDPDGKYLRLLQDSLAKQSWSCIWVDWTCAPQEPRSGPEATYFGTVLQMMPSIIQEAGFAFHFPLWEPRLWILFEIAQFLLTSHGNDGGSGLPDIAPYTIHIAMMRLAGVKYVLDEYGYDCKNDEDRGLILFWLDVLVVCHRLNLDWMTLRRM
ncbi:hypothetical protein LTR95_019235, partial [Oleoguttula sp. CCFEE 5521]